MDVIKFPECGQEISDRAAVCPNCAHTVTHLKADGIVHIKLTAPHAGASDEKQKATISADGKVIWEGHVGEAADIILDKTTSVEVKYHMGEKCYGGYCCGVIDPARVKSYCVYARQSFLKTIIELQPTD